MRYLTLFLTLFAGSILIGPSVAHGQAVPLTDKQPPPADNAMHDGPPEGRRPNLLAELGLSPEQIQHVRRMNQERQPQIRRARMRMADAQRSLDMAIYGDTLVTDTEFQTRLKEFQAAEADLARLRFENELSVRKVLTAEQLVRFREIRRRFAEARQGDQPGRMRPRRGDAMRPGMDAPPKRPIN
jgi:Spy/CpxP family protein refolding chaperone